MSVPEVVYGVTKDFVFREALEFLEDKVTLAPEEYRKLSDDCRARAFTVSAFTQAEVLQEFLDELVKAVEEGSTMEDFRKHMESFLTRGGYEPSNPYRLDTIFYTNLQTAYSVGHYKSMTEPEVLKLRPYWQYRTAGDGRVRETHAAMDGKVYRADDPIWNVWYPPNGFRCRCQVVTLSERQVRQRGLKVETEAPEVLDMDTGEIRMAVPDKGFGTNPARTVYRPDVTKLSGPIRKLYRERKP